VKELLSYGLAIAGLVVAAIAAVGIAGRLKYFQIKPAVLHLLRTNPNQAELMWRSAKGTCLEALATSMKTAAMMKSNDPAAIVAATKPSYDAACATVALHWKGVIKKIKTSLMLSFGGVALAFSVGALPIVHILALVACGAVAGWAWSFKSDAERSLVLARAELLPEVERAFVDGRYVLPP
jgi:hypothetical protein